MNHLAGSLAHKLDEIDVPVYDAADVAFDSDVRRWQGAVLFMECWHRGIRGWWHRLIGQQAHIIGYIRNL